MRTPLRALSRAITISLLGVAPVTQAASNSANFDVSIQVNATCAISASNMTFSSITTGTTSNTDATSTLTVNCSNGTPYTISLGNGANFSNVRRMAWGGSYINMLFIKTILDQPCGIPPQRNQALETVPINPSPFTGAYPQGK